VTYSQKKTSRALNNKKLTATVSRSSVRDQMNGWRVTSSAVAWRRTAMATQWRQMADCSKRELQRLRRRGHRRWHDTLVECSARTSKRNEVAVESACLPHGAVLVQGMAEPYHACNGRQAQRACYVGCSKEYYSNRVGAWSEWWRWQWYNLRSNQGKDGYDEAV